MTQIVTTDKIKETKAFKGFEKVFQQMVLKLPNLKLINHGLIVHRSTGVIPGTLSGNNLKVLKEIIDTSKN